MTSHPSLLAILRQIGRDAVILGNRVKRQEQRLKLANRDLRSPCVTRRLKAARKKRQKAMRRNPAMYAPVAKMEHEAERHRDCFEKLANWAASWIGKGRLDVQRAVLTADLVDEADARIIKELRTLDQLSETKQVIEECRAEYPDVVPLGLPQKKKNAKRRRRPSKTHKPRPLTVPQTEAVQIVGECKGNIAQAARRLGKDRKTVEQAYRAGLAKLGKQTVKHGTRTFARDRRGQVDLAEGEDRRG